MCDYPKVLWEGNGPGLGGRRIVVSIDSYGGKPYFKQEERTSSEDAMNLRVSHWYGSNFFRKLDITDFDQAKAMQIIIDLVLSEYDFAKKRKKDNELKNLNDKIKEVEDE